MKKLLLALLAFVGLFSLGACNNDKPSEGPSKPTPPVTEPEGPTDPKPDPEPTPDPEVPQIDYTIKTECEAGSIEEGTYTYSDVKPELLEDYFVDDNPEIEILVNQANWASVSAISTSNSEVLSENEEVVPAEAVTYKEVLNNGTISSIKLTIDRTKLKVGSSKVKVYLKPYNGVTTATPIDLCFEVKVVAYGSFDPEMYEVTLSLDTTVIPNDKKDTAYEFRISDQDHVYGYSFPMSTKVEIKKDSKEITVRVPKGHQLYLLVSAVDDWKDRYEVELGSDSALEAVSDGYVFNSNPTSKISAKLVSEK